MWALAGLPVTTCYNQASLLLAVYCVYCVIETKASLLYWLPNPHNVSYLSVAIAVTRYHNMAVYEADLIASQILKEFVISKWNKTNNECSILRRIQWFQSQRKRSFENPGVKFTGYSEIWTSEFFKFKATARIFKNFTHKGKSNQHSASCLKLISQRPRPEFRATPRL